jgi:catechol-2,3-dioxygenase
MPVIKLALHHVKFKTTRLDEMMAWYGTVLGGTIKSV